MKKLLSFLLVVLMVFSLCACVELRPEEFHEEGMNITLTNAFWKTRMEGLTVCYDSPGVAVLALKEPFTLQEGFGDLTIDEYAELVRNANSSKLPTIISHKDGLVSMEYIFRSEVDDQVYKYFSTMFKAPDAFWLVQFTCTEDTYDAQKPNFIAWAKTITFDA